MKKCPACGRENADDCFWCPKCGADFPQRSASPAILLNRVVDRDSFIEFVTALAEERAEAESIEKNNTQSALSGEALGWSNCTISDFLYASLVYFEEKPFHKPEALPSWKMLAEILYFGKIIE